ncbi:MAG: hypothetical protein ABFS12_04480 [Bacteroidota bacterium]
MLSQNKWVLLFLFLISTLLSGCEKTIKNIERPEKIVSKRIVVYDQETYSELADLWKTYYEEFPSEDAYANWMYAARYAKWENYESLLSDGLSKYPANPTLLYLSAINKKDLEENLESISMLEKAVRLDPTYLDPWFALVIDHMKNSDMEKSDVALRHLLEGGGISDVIMDYNYNVLSLLDKNAILITNGDNDTYPSWILTRILKYRPDVTIINRHLLNTEWYPKVIKMEGAPNFLTEEKLSDLKNDISSQIKKGKKTVPSTGPFSDTLLTYIIEKARTDNIPIYFAATLFSSDVVDRYKEGGKNLGLVTFVGKNSKPYSSQIKNVIDKWLVEFRTGGMNSWILKHSDKVLTGRWHIMNYAAALNNLMEPINKFAPERRLELFNWYQNNLLNMLELKYVDDYNQMWCDSKDIKEIYDWCKKENYLE